MLVSVGLVGSNGAAGKLFSSMMKGRTKMMNVTVSDRTSAAYLSEMDYAASMHFSAAHLPGGTSSSLVVEDTPVNTDSSLNRNPQHVQQQQSRHR